MAVAVQEPSRLRWPDLTIMVLAIILAVAGVVVSGSARVFTEAVNARGLLPGGIVRSFVHLGLGVLVMILTMLPDYRRFARGGLAWTMLIGICFLLVLALVCPAVGNTHRWIHIGRFSLQPSEPAKAVLVLLVAATIAHADREIETVREENWFRVLVGPYASREQLASAQKQLAASGFSNLLLQQRQSR